MPLGVVPPVVMMTLTFVVLGMLVLGIVPAMWAAVGASACILIGCVVLAAWFPAPAGRWLQLSVPLLVMFAGWAGYMTLFLLVTDLTLANQAGATKPLVEKAFVVALASTAGTGFASVASGMVAFLARSP